MRIVGDSTKIQNKELIKLKNSLEAANRLSGENEIGNRGKFFYAVNKNLDKIESELSIIEKIVAVKPGFAEFEKDRMAKLNEAAKKDEKGNPVIITENNLQRIDVEDMEKWEATMKELQEKHKKAIEERESQKGDYEKFLEEESEIELHNVTLSAIPFDCSGELQRELKILISDY